MNHADSGRLMAYLDGELADGARASLSTHLRACPACDEDLRELAEASRVFASAIARTDGPIPMLAARAGLGRVGRRLAPPWAASRFLKAAAVVLLLAGAASAAIPDSPLRRLAEGLVERAAQRTSPAGQAAAPVASEPAAEPAGVPVTQGLGETALVGLAAGEGPIRVSVHGPAAGATISIRLVDGNRVRVRALDAADAVRFVSGTGFIDVYDVRAGVAIELPRTLESATIEVDGRPFFVKRGSDRQLLGPGARTIGADEVVFRAGSD